MFLKISFQSEGSKSVIIVKLSFIIKVSKLNFLQKFYSIELIFLNEKESEMSEDSAEINEYNLTINMVKMKVKFPCRMKI